MNPPSPLSPQASTDELEWSGSELAAVDTAGPNTGTCTLRFAAARVWREGVPGFWPDWRLTLWTATPLALPTAAFGRVTEGHWTPIGGHASARWGWPHASPGPGELVLRLAHGEGLRVFATAWSVQASSERPWREDWSC